MLAKLFATLQWCLPQHLLSRFVGWVADSEVAWVRTLFIRVISGIYEIDLSEAARKNVSDYRSFNDFFTRELIPGARSIQGRICSPADGVVSAAGTITDNCLIQAKGMHYPVDKLLAKDTAHHFDGGSFLTIYLAPHNYHRVHIPVSARVTETRYVPGKLFSVNQATTQHVKDLFAINERLVCDLDSEIGDACLVMVGAMIVAGITTSWKLEGYKPGQHLEEQVNQQLDKGDELGRFHMGSTVILLFKDHIDWGVGPGDEVSFGDALSSQEK